jgi:hypothetical protein
MVYMVKGKVSSLRLMAIIWTTSSESDHDDAAGAAAGAAARQACGDAAAARWGNAQSFPVAVSQ